MTQVQQGDTVRIHFTGKRANGRVFSASKDGPPVRFTAGEKKVIAGIDQAVIGMRQGETKTIVLPPEKAYGNHRDELVVTVSRKRLPDDLEPQVGQQLRFERAPNEEIVAKVIAVTDSKVTVDANHPLSGEEVTFDIEVVDIANNGGA